MLYVILVFIISTILIKIDSAVWINVFEVMITAYFTIIYEEMKSMKIFSHGVSSGKSFILMKIGYTNYAV